MDYIGINLSQTLWLWLKTQKRIVTYWIKYFLPHLNFVSKTRQIRGSKKGKSCFAFANGSSLKQIDPQKIAAYQKQGFELLALNTFIETEFAKIARPDHYILSDPMSFGIKTGLFFGETDEDVKRLKGNTDRVIDLGIPIYAPFQYISTIASYPHAYGFSDVENLFGSNTDDLLKPRGYITMTAFKMLAVAQYLGFDRIYICGIDNDYFKYARVNSENEISYEDHHFFESSTNQQQAKPKEHKVGNLGKQGRVGLGEMMYRWHFLFKDLEKFDSSRIVNLNPNSLVDAFPKKHNLDVYV